MKKAIALTIFTLICIALIQWDAICHSGSYGYEHGLLEIYGNIVDYEKDGDSVAGWLTADDIIQRFQK